MTKLRSLDVLIIDDEPKRAEALFDALNALGHKVVCHLPNPGGLSDQVSDLSPDIVIIDMDSPDRDTLESMAAMSRSNPRPIVFFAEKENHSDSISAAINAGVSAYIADGLQIDRVKVIMETAIAQFDAFQTLRSELEQTRSQLNERKVIEKAKGMLMKHQGCDEEQAYKTLRKLAMDRSQKLIDVARNVIDVLAVAAQQSSKQR
ncbi:MAG: ANTAR domain-containing response regulator [Pontibacterium sp.]